MAEPAISNTIRSGVEKVQELVGGEKGAKLKQLDEVSHNYGEKNARITSDYGVKQTNTDDWLKVASEDRTGPMLLEDGFAREKVLHILYPVEQLRKC